MATDGVVGEVPLWYSLVQAARYLHVPPWELAKQPVWWMRVAQAAQGAESVAKQRKG
jgi:hypothetical protein